MSAKELLNLHERIAYKYPRHTKLGTKILLQHAYIEEDITLKQYEHLLSYFVQWG